MPAEDPWRLARIGELIRESRIKGSNGSNAKKLTIRLYGRGIVASNDRGGSEATNYFRRKKGQFAYSKLDCLNGAFGIIPEHLDGYETTLDLPAFDFVGRIDPKWFLKTVSRPAFYGRFKFAAIGSRKANRVPTDEFLATKLSVPPLAEQRAIAEVLGTVDEAIIEREAFITAIGEAKRSVMHELLTWGIRRVKAMMKPLPARWVLGRVAEGITHMPCDWRLVTLTNVAKLETGHTPSRDKPEYWGGDIPWLSLADTDALDMLTVDETAECVTESGIAHSSARVLPKDTVAFSRTATVGKATRFSRPMATSQDFANWVCGPELRPDYLVQVFRHMQREWARLQEGSTHQTVYMPVFRKLQIFLPPKDEQEKIAAIGEAFDIRVASERQAVKVMIEARDALAQELLSGRLRLPESMIARHREKPERAA